MTIASSSLSGVTWAAGTFRLSEWPSSMPTPTFHLIDMNGRPRRLIDYRGKIVIVFFGFAQCAAICPTTMVNLAHVMTGLGGTADQVQVLFITLDPDRDTPKILKSYVSAFNPNFIGLTGSHDDINRAAESFSIHYAKVGRGEHYSIDHSTGIYVCDRSGHLRLVGNTETRAADWTHDVQLLAMR